MGGVSLHAYVAGISSSDCVCTCKLAALFPPGVCICYRFAGGAYEIVVASLCSSGYIVVVVYGLDKSCGTRNLESRPCGGYTP